MSLSRVFLPDTRPVLVSPSRDACMVVTAGRSRLGPLPVRILGSAAGHHASLTDMLCDPVLPEAAIALFEGLQHLGSWDLLHFRAVPESGPLHLAANAAGAAVSPEPHSHAIPLYQQFISAGRHRELRRLLRLAKEKTGVIARVLSPGHHEWARIIEDLPLLHRARWRGTATPSPFEDEGVRQRLVTWLVDPPHRWSPVAVALATDESTAGVVLGFDDGHRLHAWRIAYHPDFLPYSPVRQLLTLLALHGAEIGRASLELGRGDDQYKQSWTTIARSRVSIRWHRDTTVTRSLSWLGKVTRRRWLDRWGSTRALGAAR